MTQTTITTTLATYRGRGEFYSGIRHGDLVTVQRVTYLYDGHVSTSIQSVLNPGPWLAVYDDDALDFRCTCRWADDEGDPEVGPHPYIADADELCPEHGRAADPETWAEDDAIEAAYEAHLRELGQAPWSPEYHGAVEWTREDEGARYMVPGIGDGCD